MSNTYGYQRYQILDLIRGIAIGLMFIYHLSFGLAQLGVFEFEFSTDLFWISFRALIVFLFLSLVGIGLYLATRKQLNIQAYVKRLLLLLLYALLITLLSYIVRPSYYVSFGILHLIFVGSVLGLFFVGFYRFNLVVGIGLLLVGATFSYPAFDQPSLQWIGMTTIRPIADDYAPVIPWFGLVLIGLFLGKALFEKYKNDFFQSWQANHWATKLICWAGRHSIHLYFVHFQLFYLLVYFLD